MKQAPRWSLYTLAAMLVAVLVFVGFPASVGSRLDLTRSYAQNTGPVRVAITVGLVPWQYMDKAGKLTGFEVEMLRDLGRRLNREVEFIDTQWEGIFAGLQANKYDIIASAVSITCARQKIVSFSVPYYDAGIAITVQKNDKRIKVVENLKGMVVGVAGAGTTAHLWLMQNKVKYGIKEVKVYDKDAMLDLEIGRIDAVAGDYPASAYYVKDRPVLEVRLRNLTAENYGLVLGKGVPLVGQVNTVINAMKKDGTMARLHREHFGFQAPADSTMVKVVPPISFPEGCK